MPPSTHPACLLVPCTETPDRVIEAKGGRCDHDAARRARERPDAHVSATRARPVQTFELALRNHSVSEVSPLPRSPAFA
jgi:hypothetical protein